MWRHTSGIAVIAGLICLPSPTRVQAQAPAQAPAPRTEAEIQAARDAQGYAPTRLWERPDVRATRVDLKPMATRAVHQHDDVKFHLFIPLAGTLQLTVGSDKPVDAPVGQAFYIKGGTPHGFRNLGSTPGMAMEIFVTNGSTASLDAVGAIVAALQAAPVRPELKKAIK
jgi:mannose-6-phosphate isomerase-like protein (cupin superfamily)